VALVKASENKGQADWLGREDGGDQDGPLGQSQGKRPLATLFDVIMDFYGEWLILALLVD